MPRFFAQLICQRVCQLSWSNDGSQKIDFHTYFHTSRTYGAAHSLLVTTDCVVIIPAPVHCVPQTQ